MLEQEQLEKIHDLARKSRLEGLSQAEREEQNRLRTMYLQHFQVQFYQLMYSQDTGAPETAVHIEH